MQNRTYDIAKWGVMVAAPALATLVGGLAVIWGFDPEKIVLTITALNTFAGALLGVSAYSYNKREDNEELRTA